jgi:hypothetical protein
MEMQEMGLGGGMQASALVIVCFHRLISVLQFLANYWGVGMASGPLLLPLRLFNGCCFLTFNNNGGKTHAQHSYLTYILIDNLITSPAL